MSKIRLAAFDFDGTLVPKDILNLDLETDIVALLQKLRQQGVYITVATGRHPSYILKRIHRFTFDAIVGYSGNVTLIANQLQ
ncbi:MAG: HAD family hydrolase, partial [Holdemania massiliensis]